MKTLQRLSICLLLVILVTGTFAITTYFIYANLDWRAWPIRDKQTISSLYVCVLLLSIGIYLSNEG